MNETAMEVSSLLQDQEQPTITTTTAARQPPRRPRVREVSSRFMSPIVASSSSGDLHLPASECPISKHAISSSTEFQCRRNHQRSQSVQRRHPELEPLCCADDNRLETVRSLEIQSKGFVSMQRKQRPVKLFKENGGGGAEQQRQYPDAHSRTVNNGKIPGRSGNFVRSRPDTPILHNNVDKMSNPRSILSTHSFQRSTNIGVTSVTTTAAAKLVQSSLGNKVAGGLSEVAVAAVPVHEDNGRAETLSENSTSSDETCSISHQGGTCTSPPIPVQNCKLRSLPDFLSSMPEASLLPTMSTRSGNVLGDSSKASASPCYRSLNSPLPSCEHSLFSSAKSIYKSSSVASKPHPSSLKTNGICLPPHPPNTKPGMEVRKVRRVSSHQEDVHALRLLHNHYLQWRYANAKAEAAMRAQRSAAQRLLYALWVKISELHDSVKRKGTELGQMKKTRTVSAILEAQMPYLNEWSALEGDYSSSLSGVIKALEDASLRLPINGNVRVDIGEMEEAFSVASNLMEIISSHVESFLPKTEKMDKLTSELAEVASKERALVEECGYRLTRTQLLQVEECSLRGQLIQLKRSSSGQPMER